MKKTSGILAAMMLTGLLGLGVIAQDKGIGRHPEIIRVSPSAFQQLPRSIRRYLEKRNCTIPQTFLDRRPHNVIRGRFARPDQVDWAVLCSRDGSSSILIFWKGSTRRVASIARSPDEDYLQGTGGGQVGFSRLIGAAGKDYIQSRFRSYGGSEPPPIHHQGINDAFAEKASVVRYLYRGRWLELQGAD